jgi:hypothetical protein
MPFYVTFVVVVPYLRDNDALGTAALVKDIVTPPRKLGVGMLKPPIFASLLCTRASWIAFDILSVEPSGIKAAFPGAFSR